MDPVTGIQLASSAADLAILVFDVFSNLRKYYRNVKNGPKRSAELRAEIDSLLDLIGVLEETFEANPGRVFQSALEVSFHELRDLLTTMQQRTSPEQTEGFRRLRWPFKEHENEEFISKIARHRDKLSLALHIEQRSGFEPLTHSFF